MMKERLELSIQRIKEIAQEKEVREDYQEYFHNLANFLLLIDEVYEQSVSGEFFQAPFQTKKSLNHDLYRELLLGNYEKSYLNPQYAVKQLGMEYGQVLSAVYAEMISLISYAVEKNIFQMVIRMEWFLEIYYMFVSSKEDAGQIPEIAYLRDTFSSFAYDYLDDFMEENVTTSFTLHRTFAKDIILNSDLFHTDYLYSYGEYITDNEIKMAEFMAGLPQEQIDMIADTFTEGYRLGFISTGKDISIKKTVNVRYFIGFERVVKAAMDKFKAMGLDTIIYRAQPSFIMGRTLYKNGYFSTVVNKQFECDHEYDKLLYFSNKYVSRKLEAYQTALELFAEDAAVFGGPAVIESFGEEPFTPVTKKENFKPSDTEQKRMVEYMAKAGELLNRYVKGEERSFTIIAFPTPQIGEQFQEIFEEIIKINTLDYIKYRDFQQTLINALDKAYKVRVKGKGNNHTDLEVALWELKNPEKETIFENCVADVNIPVGEVFTSPKLKGTNGRLHVTEVYLNGLKYKDLELTFKDGMIIDYQCANFLKESENKDFIKEHLLFQHDTLPMGEFAIGTNTTAYVVSKKYKIEDVMPILIAEKTGPHFAVGDTCYSHEEDLTTYNPDGKVIVARENDVSALRHTDRAKAYLNCHTDITIPYDELREITAVCKDETECMIIKDGRFVLKGLEELNKPFDE